MALCCRDAADLVPELPVIPVEQQAVELVVNDVPAPGEDWPALLGQGTAGWFARCSDHRCRACRQRGVATGRPWIMMVWYSRVEVPERLEPSSIEAEALRQLAAEKEIPMLIKRVALEVLIAVHRQLSQDPMQCKFAFNSSCMFPTRLHPEPELSRAPLTISADGNGAWLDPSFDSPSPHRLDAEIPPAPHSTPRPERAKGPCDTE